MTAKAKINLGLDITGRLENGYHGVRMLMQTLDFGDEVTLRCDMRDESAANGQSEGHASTITLTCSDPALPCDERNLAYRAAKLLVDACGDRQYRSNRAVAVPELSKSMIDIHIDKRIPLAAGLAGGSADAAAVLVGLNELGGLGLSQQELMDIGLCLGADVPFCILQGTALSEGIGEQLTPLPTLTGIPVLLVKPDIAISTQWAYESWDSLEHPAHPDIDALADAVRTVTQRGQDSEAYEATILSQSISGHLGNTFEQLVFDKYPVVREIKEELLRHGATGALMSGSGPTVFGIFPDDAAMAAATREMRERYPKVFICETQMM